jgi:hypothetical protein
MSLESNPNQLPRCQSEWDPEDLEWLEQQVQQHAVEDGGDGGTEPTVGPSIDPGTTPSEATPANCSEEHPEDVKLPAIRNNASDIEPAPAIPNEQPLLNGLLVSQLGASVPQWLSKPELAADAIALYQKFEPQDAIETVLSALTVGLFNASMDGLDRAARPGLKPEVRQMELRLTHSGTAQLTNLIKTLQAHRGLGTHKVSVGSVNVSSGANAIVGNVAGRQAGKD